MYASGLISSDLLHQQLDEHCRLLAHSGYLNGSGLRIKKKIMIAFFTYP
ncbi:hypothetical protein FHS16_003647 [Paenibacillus endophyticus]|uniref:Uncharacterized protein n=1 Tax=Paenibacillus endophyticus TaxID=1294268 RepID=A0A7W5C9G9_9BACL|nr:hypothetical protein [Paenibacillus endophyticus]MBB3153572.1 hypothetical protein [Paenibacillus endophyticus]